MNQSQRRRQQWKGFVTMMWFFACSSQNPGKSLAHVRNAQPGLVGGPYEVSLIGEQGEMIPTFTHHGRVYVLGRMGCRYQIRVKNHTGGRVEAVVSVDGRDAVDGRPATPSKRGYVLMPYGEVHIDGFRLSTSNVAAFRFSSVGQSYAAKMGDANNVGVIGVAFFTEQPLPDPVFVPHDSSNEAPAESKAGNAGQPTHDLGKRSEARKEAPSPAAAGTGAAGRAAPIRERFGLGTAFGETRFSPITETEFVRANPHHPDHVLSLRYNDKAGLLALGIDVDGSLRRKEELRRREWADPFPAADRRFATPPPTSTIDWQRRAE